MTNSTQKKRKKHAPRVIGARYGRLVILKLYDHQPHRNRRWLCQCDCGNQTIVWDGNLILGFTRSCGCQEGINYETGHGSNFKHGLSDARIYKIWIGMHQRCKDPGHKAWGNYGGRGIRICERWESFQNFYQDMGDPGGELSIDRIDNNGNYEPSNCRWATQKEQMHNTRLNVWLESNGRRMIITDWALELGVSRQVIERRLKLGWSVDKALSRGLSFKEPKSEKHLRLKN